MLSLDTIISIVTIFPICYSGSFFLYDMLAQQLSLQSLHRALFSWLVFFLIQMFQRPILVTAPLSHP
ncbi:hypothetical protein V8E53_008583 [Lactarius tabidus]